MEPPSLSARAFASWKQTARIGGGAIASSSAKRRAQHIALRTTVAALEADPTGTRGLVGFLAQQLRTGALLRGGELDALLDQLVAAAWAPLELRIVLAGALRPHHEALAARATARALELAPADQRDVVRARIDAMAQPPDQIPDPAFSEAPVTAWKCKVARSGAAIREPASKLGGTPWWPAAAAWPRCGGCDQALLFAAQLARGDAVPLRRHDLVSLFFCDRCMPGIDDGVVQVRLSSIAGDVGDVAAPRSSMPEYRIEAKAFRDQPDEARATKASFATKLGGFPRWVQDDDTPQCPHCGARMVCLAQIDPAIDAMLMPGDSARWFVFACPFECTPTSAAAVWQSA